MRINEVDPSTSSTDEKILQVQKECSDIIKVYKTSRKRLSHGTDDVGEILYGVTRDNREPHHTPIEIQKNVDEKLAAMGFTALRSNSLFCSVGWTDTEYGDNTYDVFPGNGFTYSPLVEDLSLFWRLLGEDEFGDDDDTDEYGVPRKRVRGEKYTWQAAMKMTPQEFVKLYKFRNTNIRAALKSDAEVLIRGKFYLVNPDLTDKVMGSALARRGY